MGYMLVSRFSILLAKLGIPIQIEIQRNGGDVSKIRNVLCFKHRFWTNVVMYMICTTSQK
jgi:hypothetical protein